MLDAVMPLFFALELVIVILAHRAHHALKGDGTVFNWGPYKRTGIALFLYSYQPISASVIRFLDCRRFGDRYLVSSANAIECYTGPCEAACGSHSCDWGG